MKYTDTHQAIEGLIAALFGLCLATLNDPFDENKWKK